MNIKQEKPQIMILGTFHMRYTADLQRMEFDDLLAESRQQEIQKVVEHLMKFKPTKVALEVVKSEENKLNQEFNQYKEGQLDLAIDEVHQLGFRIASNLQHEKVHAVDWMDTVGNRGLGQVFEWAEKNQPEFFRYINDTYRSNQELSIGEKSIYEIIRSQNQKSYIEKQHEMYLAIARIGSSEEYIGIDWMRWWYQRNLILYYNLAKITSISDRTLLIIGAAHVHLVTQFLKESNLFSVVNSLDYLT
ncbi:hypothetical protein ABE65_005890 [Fictibacillus phosphorivorans]|uniref:TraB/GumN family protein n=1 Tax=Fictibacillus phosphorivorans TaxID=1221500 RepID=A0A161IIM9_9BACL|nr:DUF5694 domain-containing protein [Fictibacillus phosphorivorans]ANC76359.1 hypothetical protein ABE65_005890 [Fictibacillus phosphorivorans]